jgi:hypothetical protein
VHRLGSDPFPQLVPKETAYASGEGGIRTLDGRNRPYPVFETGTDGCSTPGAPAAAARAGLSRSRYLHDRDRLVGRGLIEVEERASGRGRSSTVALRFADEGPWWEGEINAKLFEAVLSRTRLRGPRGWCSRRWPRSPTPMGSCAVSRTRSCVRWRVWRIGRTGARRHGEIPPHDLPRSCWSCGLEETEKGNDGSCVRRSGFADRTLGNGARLPECSWRHDSHVLY